MIDIEFFPAPRQSRQNFKNIIGEKAMIVCRQTVEREIFPAARERFFREIDIDRGCAGAGRGNRKRTSVSKAIEQFLWRAAPDKLPVRALIDKETDRVTGREINSVAEQTFGRDTLQIRVRVAHHENRWIAFRVSFRKITPENPAEFEIAVERPEAKLGR